MHINILEKGVITLNIFIPYPIFTAIFKCLDWRRLGKQRVEAFQVLNITDKLGFSHHPILDMWRGYEDVLKVYFNNCVIEWVRRGYNNNMAFEYRDNPGSPLIPPPWWGNERIHASHRSNLLRKDPEWYSRFGWKEPDNLPYIWPKTDKK